MCVFTSSASERLRFFYQMPSNLKLTHHLSTSTRLFLSVLDVVVVVVVAVVVVVVAAGSLKVCFKSEDRECRRDLL